MKLVIFKNRSTPGLLSIELSAFYSTVNRCSLKCDVMTSSALFVDIFKVDGNRIRVYAPDSSHRSITALIISRLKNKHLKVLTDEVMTSLLATMTSSLFRAGAHGDEGESFNDSSWVHQRWWRHQWDFERSSCQPISSCSTETDARQTNYGEFDVIHNYVT